MLLWVVFALLTAAVLAVTLWPLASGKASEPTGTASDAAVYRDQLAEVERDRERGLITGPEAEAARAEIARRLISAVDTAKNASPPGLKPRTHTIALFAVALIVPAVALSGYLWRGAPGLPDQPLADRLNSPGSQSVGAMIAQVETRLRLRPEDGEGWDVIAPVYLRIGRFDDAADAYAKAIRLQGEDAKRLTGYGEALSLSKEGVVSDEAKTAFERAIAIDPKSINARFWLTIAKEQDGRKEEAANDWRKILAESPEQASWRRVVQARLDALEGKPARPAPEAENKAAEVEAMPPEQRQAFIEGLADRLKRDGGNVDEWQRLVRAYAVLGRRDDAIQALSEARAKFGSDSSALDKLAALARDLGLSS